MIEGVVLKELETHSDDRGFFREIFRMTDDFFQEGFGQLSHSLVYPGVVKAWHAHRVQTQWNYIACGLVRVALHDIRPESPTYRETMEFHTGENQKPIVYSFPPGVAHGYRCIAGPMHIIYITSGVYDLGDEVKIPHNDSDIGYDWQRPPQIK
jgi:dTDP-4-dehydrorhamnose 3,5-epimerase